MRIPFIKASCILYLILEKCISHKMKISGYNLYLVSVHEELLATHPVNVKCSKQYFQSVSSCYVFMFSFIRGSVRCCLCLKRQMPAPVW